MTVRISRSLLDTILAEAARAPEREICGLLLGTSGQITACLPAANVATDPARHFEVDPAMLIAAHKAGRSGGPAYVGHYHSHPSGTTAPSATDAASALDDDMLWLIVAGGEAGGEARLWRTAANGLHDRFVAVELAVEANMAGLASPDSWRQ